MADNNKAPPPNQVAIRDMLKNLAWITANKILALQLVRLPCGGP